MNSYLKSKKHAKKKGSRTLFNSTSSTAKTYLFVAVDRITAAARESALNSQIRDEIKTNGELTVQLDNCHHQIAVSVFFALTLINFSCLRHMQTESSV